MKHGVRILLATAGFAFLLLAAAEGLGTEGIKRIADGRDVGFAEMMEDAGRSNLVFIGELHDSREHHQLQLDIIKALHEKGVPLAIGLEMLGAESQFALDKWVAGKLDLQSFMRYYQYNWTIPWAMYDSIFLYSRNRKIPLIGLNVPREIARKVYRRGVSSLSGEERKRLPPDIACKVDTPYMKFIKSIYWEHETEGSSFEYFCEAQLLRNRTMAWHITDYLKKNPQRLMVVLTGVGHAMKRGVPAEIGENAGVRYLVIIPRMSELAMDTLKKSDIDYLVGE